MCVGGGGKEGWGIEEVSRSQVNTTLILILGVSFIYTLYTHTLLFN